MSKDLFPYDELFELHFVVLGEFSATLFTTYSLIFVCGRMIPSLFIPLLSVMIACTSLMCDELSSCS